MRPQKKSNFIFKSEAGFANPFDLEDDEDEIPIQESYVSY